jgi:flagellum-specific ATP synthase
MPTQLSQLARDIAALDPHRYEGRVTALSGALIEASGPQEALALGARATVFGAHAHVAAEIVGFRGDRALMAPYDSIEAIRPGHRVRLEASAPLARPCSAWLGRVIDCFGNPVDGAGPLPVGTTPMLVRAAPPSAHGRSRVGERLDTGVRALNMFAALCRGQRMGVFAGSGVGKSVLMSMLARGAGADVIVIGLVGERGREVKEFIEDTLGEEGRRRSVVVVATSDEAASRRRLAPHMACAVAEYFRDQGQDVLLLIDSVTRFAMAQREIGLSVGEPPTTKGYTPSVFAELPKLLERAGPGRQGAGGSITGLFTVLVDGDDHNEPIADAVRGILDGHIVMERAIAERGRFPAINVQRSISRLMPMCHTDDENALVMKARQILALYGEMEELIRIGAYKPGADVGVDEAVRVRPKLERFLTQGRDERTGFKDGFAMLAEALA